MSEVRLPQCIVTIKDGRRCTNKIEIFRKDQWTEEPADQNMYRLRVNRVWSGGNHSSKKFFTRDGVLAEIAKRLADGGVI